MRNRIVLTAIMLPLCLTATGLAQDTKSPRPFNIVFLGDTGHGESYQQSREKKSEENILQTKGYDHSLQQFASFLAAQDVNIANLETPLYEPQKGESAPFPDKDYIHWTRPDLSIAALKKSHIHTFSLANNHTLDYSTKGLEQSFNKLREQDCTYFGAGMNTTEAEAAHIISLPAGYAWRRVAVIGCFEYRKSYDEKYQFYATSEKPGANRLDPRQIELQATKLKQEEPATLVVLFPHWGENYTWASEDQKELAKRLIERGCDLIVGHGSHMLQEVQQVGERLAFHSLGNFMFNSNGRYEKESIHPYSMVLRLSLTSDSRDLSLNAYPILTNNLKTGFQSRFLTSDEFAGLMSIVRAREGFLAPVETGEDETGPYLIYKAQFSEVATKKNRKK